MSVKCDDCGADADCPQIWPWTWSEIAPGVVNDYDADLHEICCDTRCGCGYLCRACAERRLGRAIGDDDIDTESACDANRAQRAGPR